LLFSVIVEWIGMTLWWPGEGVGHSRNMLEKELSYINDDFSETVISSHPVVFVETVADKFYYYAYEKTKIITFIEWVSKGEYGYLGNIQQVVEPYVISAITISQLFAVRIGVLVLAMPAFILLGVVGLVEGLVERDLRKWGGGRESGTVFHYAKAPLVPILWMTWLLYLSMPVSVHPNYVILPFAIVFGFLIYLTASKFKKYL